MAVNVAKYTRFTSSDGVENVEGFSCGAVRLLTYNLVVDKAGVVWIIQNNVCGTDDCPTFRAPQRKTKPHIVLRARQRVQ